MDELTRARMIQKFVMNCVSWKRERLCFFYIEISGKLKHMCVSLGGKLSGLWGKCMLIWVELEGNGM